MQKRSARNICSIVYTNTRKVGIHIFFLIMGYMINPLLVSAQENKVQEPSGAQKSYADVAHWATLRPPTQETIILASEPKPNRRNSRFSIKLSGGASWILASDYNDYINYFNEGKTDKFGKINLGMSFQGEVIFSLGPRLGIGIGGGYFQTKRDQTINKAFFNGLWNENETIERRPGLSVIPVFLNLHLLTPLSPRVTIDLFAGPSILIANFDFYYSYKNVFLSQVSQTTFSAVKIAYGAQAGLGVIFSVSRNISFFIDGMFRLANIANLKGNYSNYSDSSLNWFGPSESAYKDYYIWKIEKGGSITSLTFYDDTPEKKNWKNWVKAKIDGFEINGFLGIKFNL